MIKPTTDSRQPTSNPLVRFFQNKFFPGATTKRCVRKFLSREGEVYMLNPVLDVRHSAEGVGLFDTTQNITLPLLSHQTKILAEILSTRIIDKQFAAFFISYNIFIPMRLQ